MIADSILLIVGFLLGVAIIKLLRMQFIDEQQEIILFDDEKCSDCPWNRRDNFVKGDEHKGLPRYTVDTEVSSNSEAKA